MSTWIWVLIVGVIVLGLASIVWPLRDGEPSAELRRTSWPEWDRAVASAPPPAHEDRAANAPRWRYTRVERLIERWRLIQDRYANDPDGAILQADGLIREVMRERGYAVADFERRGSNTYVNVPPLVKNYRAAHAISVARARGEATPDDARVALVRYRLAFEELLESNSSSY